MNHDLPRKGIPSDSARSENALEPLVSQPFRAYVYFSVPRIVRNLRANPIGNLQVLIRLREFNFGNYNTFQNIVVDIDLPVASLWMTKCLTLFRTLPSHTFAGFSASAQVSHTQILFEPYPSYDSRAVELWWSAMRTLAFTVVTTYQLSQFRVPTMFFFHPSCDKKLTPISAVWRQSSDSSRHRGRVEQSVCSLLLECEIFAA